MAPSSQGLEPPRKPGRFTQFEALLRVQANNLLEYLNNGITKPRFGSMHTEWVCDGVFECSQGGYVYVTIWGAPSYKALIEFLGFEYGSAEFPEGTVMLTWDSPGGPKLHNALADYCRATTQRRLTRR